MAGYGRVGVSAVRPVRNIQETHQYDVDVRFDIGFDWGGYNYNPAPYRITCDGQTQSGSQAFSIPSGGGKAHIITKDEIARHDHGFINGSHTAFWGSGGTVFLNSGDMQAGSNPSVNKLVIKQGSWSKTDFNSTTQKAHNNLQPYMTYYIWQKTA